MARSTLCPGWPKGDWQVRAESARRAWRSACRHKAGHDWPAGLPGTGWAGRAPLAPPGAAILPHEDLTDQVVDQLGLPQARHLDRAGRMPAALQGYAPPLGVRSGENRAARQTVGGVSGSKKGVAAVDRRDVRHSAPFLPEPIVRAAAVFFHQACCGKSPADRSKRMRSRPHTGSTTRSLPPECRRPKWATYGRNRTVRSEPKAAKSRHSLRQPRHPISDRNPSS